MPSIRLKTLSVTVKALILVGLSVLLISCETVSYYTQAARGQMAIVFGRQDIQHLLESDDLPTDLREKFSAVLDIRDFAAEELLLPVGDNYQTYVDLEREHVVWNVFAAPEFSTEPVNWCYPIAGCVAYRGYFSETAALKFAAEWERRGFDVYTGGVDAYSTLGWFEDSLLSTVMRRPDYQLAALIFHELAHQVAYVPGDTTFNESFATAVEREGLRRWLRDSDQMATIAIARSSRERQQQFVELVTSYRDKFDSLYQEQLPEQQMRQRKQALKAQLRADYEASKRQWGGDAGYDTWFANPLNNAQLSTVGSYNDLVPFFMELLAQAGGNLEVFYEEVERIAALDLEQRELITQAVD